ncbi:hypothetical protein [Streptomyces lavenduligriseus]|uniref:Secreted protein n=1 Tax=Streptomyces lavenduligriseus TaxID=67315 RepID=A0ABT0NYA9_9ACTN|nr:hypothetical protein [Streptomyces lavenduligriseus]MCL3996467.1 hypothetical protein [Streptomyces lavenduligriseus]
MRIGTTLAVLALTGAALLTTAGAAAADEDRTAMQSGFMNGSVSVTDSGTVTLDSIVEGAQYTDCTIC